MRNENGMTMIEVLVSMFAGVLLIGILASVLMIGMQKTDYINVDSSILRGESNLVNWVKKDYRENTIQEIRVEEDELGENTKLVMVLGEDEEIIYENRPQGFYRTDRNMSVLLMDNAVNSILLSEQSVKFLYDIGGEEKEQIIILVK